MVGNIEIYFSENPNTPHNRNTEENERIRKSKAYEQVKLPPAPMCQVFNYVNEFLEKLEGLNGKRYNTPQIDTLLLDGKKQIIVNKGIIVRECEWIVPVWDEHAKRYSIWEPKYKFVQEKFGLSHTKNILWLKFTDSGHLGVVAKGMDINFAYNLTSGKLVSEIGKRWDESFVLIFPLTDVMLNKRDTGDIERAVGNYLVSKEIPIIDFYSHNY